MISVAAFSSAIRTRPMSARTSGVSIAGLRMSPSSPPVAVTSTVCTPSAWYLATVGAPLEASSSGCAWTLRRQRRSGTCLRLAAALRRAARLLVRASFGAAVVAGSAGATAPPLGFMLDTHGRYVPALPRHLPFEGQQGPGQDGGPPRHARPVLRAPDRAADEGAAGRGGRGDGPQADRVAGAGAAEAGRQAAGPGEGRVGAGQRGPGPRGPGAAGRAG